MVARQSFIDLNQSHSTTPVPGDHQQPTKKLAKELVLCQYSFDGCRSPIFILEKAQTKVWTPTGTRQNKVDRVLDMDDYFYDILPQEKANIVEQLQKRVKFIL